MSHQINTLLANQTVHFRGTSTVGVSTSTIGNLRSISGAVYAVRVSGGVSGSFGAYVQGKVGDQLYTIAGITSIGAGNFIMHPTIYTAAGAEADTEEPLGTTSYTIHDVVPPSSVSFESGVATQGISATIEVSASIRGER